jgi:hypothetical protein
MKRLPKKDYRFAKLRGDLGLGWTVMDFNPQREL